VTDVARYRLEDGGSVLVEVEPLDRGPVRRGARIEERVQEAGDTLEHVLGQVAPIATGLIARIRERDDWPNEVEVEFGVKLTAEAGVIIARAAGEANFRLLMRWAKGDGT
jgi:hypothetical protein